MPLQRRLPKRGFTNIFKKQFNIINIKDLAMFEANSNLDAKVLMDAYLRCECAQKLDSYDRLTDREREILILVAEGCTNQQIANLLHVSPKTVDGHRGNLMSKLDLHDRTEVVKYALRKRLIDL